MDHTLFVGMSHVAYNCSNLEKSLHFYCDLLGFTIKFRMMIPETVPDDSPFAELKGRPSITYLQAPDGSYIELFTERSHRLPKDPEDERVGYAHLSLQVTDINAAIAQLTKEGVRVDTQPNLGPDKTYQAWIRDPDGNRIELMEYTKDSLQL